MRELDQDEDRLKEDEPDLEELERRLQAARSAWFAEREVKQADEAEPV